MKKQSMADLIRLLQGEAGFKENIASWTTIPPRETKTVPFPLELDDRIKCGLERRGISSLYTHQDTAFRLANEGKNVVAVTPTASGKTLCYNLPVLQSIAGNEDSRALYLFPTKGACPGSKK